MKKELNEQILNDLSSINSEQEITLEDIEDIDLLFEEEEIVEVPDNLFDNIIDKLEGIYEEEYLEEKSRDKISIFDSIKYLLLAVRLQISLLDVRFWIASFIILIFGVLNIKMDENFNIILLSPIISLFSIYYLYRGKYFNVSKMEAACKYSMYEIAIARTIVIIFYNILFISCMALANYLIWDVNIWTYLIISWLSPLLFSYYLTLYFFYKKGLIESIIANICAWGAYASLFYKFNNAYSVKFNIAKLSCNTLWIIVNLVLILLSIVMLFVQFKSMKSCSRSENFMRNPVK